VTVDEIFEIAGKGTVLVVVPGVGTLRVGDSIQVQDPVTGQHVTGVVNGLEQHVHRNCFGGNRWHVTKKFDAELAARFEDECMPNGTMGIGRASRSKRKPMINPQCGSQGLDDDGHCERCGLVPIMGAHCPPGFLNPNVEMIVRAAIRYDGTVYSLPAPARHHNVIALMISDGLPNESCALPNQGFVTSTDRFVDRYEGFKIARAAGQLWRSPTPPDMLTSEDVW